MGTDVNARNHNLDTPLHLIGLLNEGQSPDNRQCCQLLIEAGVDVNATNKLGQTPLHVAAYSGQASLVAALLENSAQVNLADKVGMTPLHAAAAGGRPDCLRRLIESGADVNAKTDRKQTPLHVIQSGMGRDKVSISPTFYEQLLRQNPFTEKLQTQIVST